jgi:hypothetical protein
MRRAFCPACNWTGHVDTREGEWRTVCPTCETTLRPLLHIPYDPPLLHELNAERYELAKTGHLLFNHAEGTHDDRFWALALAVHAADARAPTQKPLARI